MTPEKSTAAPDKMLHPAIRIGIVMLLSGIHILAGLIPSRPFQTSLTVASLQMVGVLCLLIFNILYVSYEKWGEAKQLPSPLGRSVFLKWLGWILVAAVGGAAIYQNPFGGVFFTLGAAFFAVPSTGKKHAFKPLSSNPPSIPYKKQPWLLLGGFMFFLLLNGVGNVLANFIVFSSGILLFGLISQCISPYTPEWQKATEIPVTTTAGITLSEDLACRIPHLIEIAQTQPEKIPAMIQTLQAAHPLKAIPQFQAIKDHLMRKNSLHTFDRVLSLEYVGEMVDYFLQKKLSEIQPQYLQAKKHYCLQCRREVERRELRKYTFVQCAHCHSYDAIYPAVKRVIGTPMLQQPRQKGTTLWLPIWDASEKKVIPGQLHEIHLPASFNSSLDWFISALFHQFAEHNPLFQRTIMLQLEEGLTLNENTRLLLKAGQKAGYWQQSTAVQSQ